VARSRKSSADTSAVVGYVRVSTDEQAVSGLGLASQRAAIEAECTRRGWALVAIHEDALSGKNMARPGLEAALAAVESDAASAIVVAKLDRLSRSLSDFAGLMVRARAGRWNLVAVDLGIDLATAAGEFMGNVLASAAQWERRIIGQRTKDALAVKRAQGVRLGRPQMISADLVARIRTAHQAGAGWSALARQLNDEGVATVHGGTMWYASTVRAVVLAAEAVA
jgi:DNA invertase Pin-like site-specific DNA recombinase